jgi:hypothetical protein
VLAVFIDFLIAIGQVIACNASVLKQSAILEVTCAFVSLLANSVVNSVTTLANLTSQTTAIAQSLQRPMVSSFLCVRNVTKIGRNDCEYSACEATYVTCQDCLSIYQFLSYTVSLPATPTSRASSGPPKASSSSSAREEVLI